MIALKFSRLAFDISLYKHRLRVTLGEELIALLTANALYEWVGWAMFVTGISDVPIDPNQVWSMDFMFDQFACGETFRTYHVMDNYNREDLGGLASCYTV